MNFDMAEVLTGAGRITWKHKVLWLFSALPVLLSLLVAPFAFLSAFSTSNDPYGQPPFLEQPIYAILFVVFVLFISILSYVLYGISSSSVMLGALRADDGIEQLRFSELFNDGKKYWLRILGVIFSVGLGVFIVFAVIFGCITFFGAVTMGLGFICIQPLILLMYPLLMVVYSFIEEAQVAVIVDELGVIDAITRSWELVKANFWRIMLLSLIVYLGIGFLSVIVMLPFILIFFFAGFFLQGQQGDLNVRTMLLSMGAFSLIFLPFMAFFQGITITFMKSTYTLMYLRLTRPQESVPAVSDANA